MKNKDIKISRLWHLIININRLLKFLWEAKIKGDENLRNSSPLYLLSCSVSFSGGKSVCLNTPSQTNRNADIMTQVLPRFSDGMIYS